MVYSSIHKILSQNCEFFHQNVENMEIDPLDQVSLEVVCFDAMHYHRIDRSASVSLDLKVSS